MTGLTVVLTVVFGFIWMEKEISNFNQESEKTINSFTKSHEDKVRDEVVQASEYIQYKLSTTEQRLKEEIKNRITFAFQIVAHIYEVNKDSKNKPEIEKLIKDALHPASWDDGTGYYFAFDTNGIEKINRNNTDLVGKNMLGFQDLNGKYVIRDMLAITSEKSEGYVSYYWNKPSNPDKQEKKISYVRLFEPLGLVIGTGKYIDDERKILQKEALQRISSIKLPGDRYYFAGTLDGISLTGPTKGRSMLEIEDVNGVKIVKELIFAAHTGGGFIEYVMPKLEGNKPLPKISYSMKIDEWNWYIGSGIYIHEIENIIANKKAELRAKIQDFIIKHLLISLGLMLVIIFVVVLITKRIKANMDSFSSYFSRSSTENIKIDEDNLSFTEFHQLAVYANDMLNKRIKAEEAEQIKYQQYMAIFESSRDAIILFNSVGGIIDCNPAAVDMFKAETKEQICGLTPHDLSPKYQPDGQLSEKRIIAAIAEALESGSHSHEWMSIKLNGEEFFATVNVSKIVINEEPILFATLRDVTESKRAQALLIQSEKMLSVGGLAAGMAHEINNPLAGMMQTASSLENRLLKIEEFSSNVAVAEKHQLDINNLKQYMYDRGIDRMVKTIKDSGSRVAYIVKNMLSFARSSDSENQLHDITTLADEAIELAQIDFSQKKSYDFRSIKINKEYSTSIPQVMCQSGMIQQVVLNILQNGAHGMFSAQVEIPAFTIRCWYEQEKDMVGLEIEDNGPGIEKEAKESLFQPFFTTKAAGIGTGLGLSVSYYIITENHHGELTEESKPGDGAKFRILLPVNRRQEG